MTARCGASTATAPGTTTTLVQVHWRIDLGHDGLQGIQEAHIVSLALAYELEAVCAVLSTGHILTINIQGQDR